MLYSKSVRKRGDKYDGSVNKDGKKGKGPPPSQIVNPVRMKMTNLTPNPKPTQKQSAEVARSMWSCQWN